MCKHAGVIERVNTGIVFCVIVLWLQLFVNCDTALKKLISGLCAQLALASETLMSGLCAQLALAYFDMFLS